MAQSQEEMIKEEQEILNRLIHDMDQTLLQLDKKLTYEKLQAKKAKEACLPDAYGMLVSAEHDKIAVRQKMRELYNGKDELYETRLVLDIADERGNDQEEIKIGLHTYLKGPQVFIMSWKMPLCRHYILDNAAEEYDGVVTDKYGDKTYTHYQLRLKRQVKILFDKVKNVTHFFPTMDEEMEQIIADEFLQELLTRRSGQEFKNIVFSIQKKQGEIIQTPFKQNLIVQGCAGSGKSMIMLHRLPIVIYDNPNNLDRNNLYIITPSIAYIQMANKMRFELEIEDLQMGTLEQYYNHVLEKYGLKSDIYGTIKPYIKLAEEDMTYVYSSDCIEDIRHEIDKVIADGYVDYKRGQMLLNIVEQDVSKTIETPLEKIRAELIQIQNVINVNDNSLRAYHRDIYDLLEQVEECARMLENRKISVNRGISKMIAVEEKVIIEKEKEIAKITDKEAHKEKYLNRLNSIKAAERRIADLKESQEIVELDNAYFERLKEYAQKVRQLLAIFAMIKGERMEMTIDEQYEIISKKDILCAGCKEMLKEIAELEDPYWEYSYRMDSESKKMEPYLLKLDSNKSLYLPNEYVKKLFEATKYLSDATVNTVHNVYLTFMKRLGQEPDEKGRMDALECSPYLYLQILYLFSGTPNASKESLITIDEAQNIAPEELKLIKSINGNKVIFNLFGDVKQHVEGSKGIDSWQMFSEVAAFKKENMQENYRNARQITSYCNKRFKLNMRPINLDGTGVHECNNQSEFEAAFRGIFQKPQNVGLSCILVKNKAEAETLIAMVENYAVRIHNMTSEVVELQKNKWNLMTVEQAKGLEFETVFAVSGRMSPNEKYIAYTRALDELYVYDDVVDMIDIDFKNTISLELGNKVKDGTARKKRVKRTSKDLNHKEPEKELKQFFDEKGLKVIDDRKKSGHLWVIGSRAEIDDVVSEAVEIYGINGSYGSGKVSGFKEGWFTKSKK